ncbi:hypothetical protein EC968_005951 [Mortierella alpina]|nr:hypothetical protein EC968_005951 [Mortierella alpina]
MMVFQHFANWNKGDCNTLRNCALVCAKLKNLVFLHIIFREDQLEAVLNLLQQNSNLKDLSLDIRNQPVERHGFQALYQGQRQRHILWCPGDDDRRISLQAVALSVENTRSLERLELHCVVVDLRSWKKILQQCSKLKSLRFQDSCQPNKLADEDDNYVQDNFKHVALQEIAVSQGLSKLMAETLHATCPNAVPVNGVYETWV